MKQIFLRNLLLPFAFFFSLSLTTNAQTGFAYRDLNANGAKDAGEPGVSGIQVKSFQSSGAILGTATSATDGSYTLAPAAAAGQSVRVEFYIVTASGCRPASTSDQAGYNGTLDGSSVKFVVGPASAQNFAIANINEYYTADPKVFIPLWGNGDPLAGGIRANDTAFVMFNYLNNGYAPTAPVHNVIYPNAPASVPLAKASQIGSCWGVAYSRFADRVFTSAVLRRQIGLGPLGSGGIYLINPNATFSGATGGDVSNFIDLDALGIATRTAGYTIRSWGYGQINNTCGAGTPPDNATFNPRIPFTAQVGTNADRGLAANGGISNDIAAFSQVGKVGIGDIELSEDGRYLFVTNLYDQRIYRIDLTDPANPVAPTLAEVPTKVTSWPMPTDVVATNGTLRPWGLKIKNDKVYVGIVADAGNVYYPNTNNGSTNSGMPAGALMGYVYELIPSSNTWTQKLAMDFKIRPVKAGQTLYAFYNWRNWWDTPYDAISVGSTNSEYVRSQPILSDIEFDDNGSMVVGVLDRWGLQGGSNQYVPIKGSGVVTCLFCCIGTGDGSRWGINYFQSPTSFLTYTAYGDIYRGVYNATTCNYSVETGTASDGGGCQGGANTEYYCEDGTNSNFEGNYLQGALAFKPGSGEILSNGRSPFTGHTQGVRKLSNSLGTHISEYMVLQNPAAAGTNGNTDIPGKSLGLGDIELLNTNPPLEIGNRIWEDTDNDGIQDAGEPPIAGVTVYASYFFGGSWQTISTVTDANGQYRFNLSNSLANTTLYLSVHNPLQYNTGTNELVANGRVYSLSPLNPTDPVDGGNSDYRDNDASIVTLAGAPFSGYPTIAVPVLANDWGKNNYTFDFGFKFLRILPVKITDFIVSKSSNGEMAIIQWNVGVEDGIIAYDVMKSEDGINYNKIGSVLATGSSKYIFNDVSFGKQVGKKAFYKLAIQERGGFISYSLVRLIEKNEVVGSQIVVYPNPVNDIATISIKGIGKGKVLIDIVNASGSLIHRGSTTSTNSDNTIFYDINTNKLAKGVYIVKVIGENGEQQVQKFTK